MVPEQPDSDEDSLVVSIGLLLITDDTKVNSNTVIVPEDPAPNASTSLNNSMVTDEGSKTGREDEDAPVDLSANDEIIYSLHDFFLVTAYSKTLV